MFSSNYKYVLCNVSACICYGYSIPLKELRADIRFHKGFRSVTKDSAVSLIPLNPLLQYAKRL
jgi:hypothetical protein